MLLHGASISAKDKKLNTALHLACSSSLPLFGRIEMVQFLCSRGADVNARNYLGQTPLQVVPKEYLDIQNLLISVGAQRDYDRE